MEKTSVSINYFEPQRLKNIKVKDITPGTFFTGVFCNYTGLFLRTFQDTIFMDRPSINWMDTNSADGNLEVKNFQRVNNVVIEVKD